jgi:hypothetical protein
MRRTHESSVKNGDDYNFKKEHVMKRALGCAVTMVLVSVSLCMGAVEFPYSTGFENFIVDQNVAGQFEWGGGGGTDWTFIRNDASLAAEGQQYASIGKGNGWTDYIMTPGITNTPETGKCWVEFAYKVGAENTTGDETIQIGANSGNIVYQISIAPDMKLYFNNTEVTNVSLARGQWYRYAIEVNNGSNASLYVDRQNVATAAYGSLGRYGLGISQVYFYGGYNGGGWPAGDIYGYVDDFKMGAGDYLNLASMPIFSQTYPYIAGPKGIVITGVAGATIRYTVNGTNPTETNGTVIASGTSVTVNDGTNLRARAWLNGMDPSDVRSVTYTIPTSFNQPATIPQNNSIVINGDLSEWPADSFVALNTVYEGDPYDIAEAYYAASWGSDGKIRVAVKVRDTSHYFTNTYTGWDRRDAIEVYLHTGNPMGSNEYSGKWEGAQQYAVGIKNISGLNQVWTNLADYNGSIPAGTGLVAAGKVVGEWINYEVEMTPFDYYGGITSQPNIVAALNPNDLIGLDVCVASCDNESFFAGMKSENDMKQKSFYYDRFGLHKLVAAPTLRPGDANGDGAVDVGDLGILAANYGGTEKTWAQGDFNGDHAVDVGDLGILAAHYGEGTVNRSSADFSTDYAKAFGTAVAEDTSAQDETSSSVCSALGLPLIAGLMLAGLTLLNGTKFKD